jgi:hypothetical protein
MRTSYFFSSSSSVGSVTAAGEQARVTALQADAERRDIETPVTREILF